MDENKQEEILTDDASEKNEQTSTEAVVSAPVVAAAEGEYATRSGGKKKAVSNKKTKISYEKKKGLYGYAFIGLWLVGTIYMFVIPLISSIWYSLCETHLLTSAADMEKYGATRLGIFAVWNNFGNFVNAFQNDPKFLPYLSESLSSMLPNTFMILIFSLFIALLLNQKFKGRAFARAVFFLPVLIATGPVLGIITGTMSTQGVGNADQFSTLFKADMVDDFMNFMGFSNISEGLTDQISSITSNVLNLIWKSGIQILIFLSALQQVSTSSKEAAQMEGATGWEFFWKITFPTISPMILVNLIYTVIDVFVDSQNPVMQYVIAQSRSWNFGFCTAMAWTYFLIIAVALGIITLIASKFVFYQVD